jgi:hypothetical protein
MYSNELFTDAHASLLGYMAPETYHKLAAKYTTTMELETVNIKSETFLEQLKEALQKNKMVLVDGVMHNTPDGVMELEEEFKSLISCIKDAITEEGKYYIHILGPHKTPFPHPSLLKMLEEGKYTLEGGLWAPGQAMPEQTIVAEKDAGGVKCTNFLMCSVMSNFNNLKTKGVSARTIGCDESKVPAEFMDVELKSAEHAIQLAKPVAAVAFPDRFMDTAADDSGVAKAIATAEKIKSGEEPEKDGLKRKLLSDKALTIANHCKEVYALLSKAEAFDVQKKLGQLPTLTGKWFDVVKGTPIERFRDFDAEDLQRLGANSLMQAFVIMLRIHAGDDALHQRLLFDISTDNVPVESAMHDPVKNPVKDAPSKYLFSGRFPDRVWGKVCGCPRYTVMPDRLVHSDGQPQVGHLGNGAELVRMAIKGDAGVLAFFSLDAPLAKENMGAGAARVLEKFWGVVGAAAL